MTRRAAIVTGATSAIGQAVARALAEEGHVLTLTARRADRLAAAAGELRDEGHAVHEVAAQLLEDGAAARVLAAHRERWGRLDVLVNNAGVGRGAAVGETTDEDLDLQLAVNLRTPILLYREAIDLLRAAAREHRGALVVNVASVTGVYGEPWLSVYAATKAGLINWTESMHRELSAQGIKSTALCPGFVDTPAREPGGGAPDPAAMMTPTDIAEAVRFLLRVSPAFCVPRMEMVRPGERMT
jgi:NAD(P)-dependent dehydrogenase (short-subunit alcohol dehydrogenase family)